MNKRFKSLVSIFLLVSMTSCKKNDDSSSSSMSSFDSVSTSTSSSLESSTSTQSSFSSTSISSSSSTSLSSVTSTSTSSSSSSTSSTFVDLEKNRILEAIELGISNGDKIKSGTMTYKTTSEEVVDYEYGQDNYGKFSHFIFEDNEEYYGYNASNEKYGINVEFRNISKINITQDEDFVNGPALKPYTETTYGAEGYMKSMINMITENANLDYESLLMDDGYKFSIGKVTSAGTKNYVWVNTVEFILEDGAFTSINTTLQKYSNVALNYATNTYYINPGAKPVATYQIKFIQEIGERTIENPHDIETYYFEDFDLIDSSNMVVEDTINMLAGVNPEFTISNIEPSTANIAIDPINFEKIEGENNITGKYNSSTKKYTISCSTPGEYKIKLTTYKVEKIINVIVGDPTPETMYIKCYIYSGGYYDPTTINTDNQIVNTYVGCNVFFAPTFEPLLASQLHEVVVTSGNEEDLTIEPTTINTSSAGTKIIDVYRLSSLKAGVYSIKVTSKDNENLSLTFDLNVQEAPSNESLFSKRYVQVTNGEILVDVQFTPSQDLTTGTVFVRDEYGSEGTYNYQYNSAQRKFVITSDTVSNVDFSLYFDDSYRLTYRRNNTGAEVTLNAFNLGLMLVNAEWQAFYDNGLADVNEFFVFTFKNSTTGSFIYTRLENFQQVDEFRCNISFVIEECEDGYEIILDNESKDAILEFSKVSEVRSIKIASNFRSISSVLVIDGEEKTLTHNRVRA